MWTMFTAAALAFGAAEDVATSTCMPSELAGTMPADGDAGVSPEAVITLVFTDGRCGGAFFEGELRSGTGEWLAFSIEQEDATLLRIVPEAPLVVGETVRLVGFTPSGDLDLSFTVGEEGLVMTGEPAAIELEAEVRCDGLAFTALTGTVRFDAPAGGLLQTAIVTEGVSEGYVTAGVVAGRGEVAFSADVLGTGHEHCASARLLDETGAVVWEVDGGCATAGVCPAPERTASEAAGCSTAGGVGGAGALALGLALVGLGRRRRDR